MHPEGKVAFITGGAIGFGRAFARSLGSQGWAVAIADIDLAAAQDTAAQLRAEGMSAMPLHCDVADKDGLDAAIASAVSELGGLDVLINNAGRHLSKYSQSFASLTTEEIRGLFDVNVMAVIFGTQAAAPHLAARRGSVINISSIAGYMPSAPYGVSKLAVRGLTFALAKEYGDAGIRVNAIAPGLMATENALSDLPEALVDQFVNELQLVKRLGQMDDIVKAMNFLISDDASFITGETIRVSGGYPQSMG